MRNGRSLFLECHPPHGKAAEIFLTRYLAQPTDWKVYAGKGAVAIRFEALKPEVQRELLLAVFKYDYVDETGWVHEVRFAHGGRSQETLWNLCEWLTGNGFNQSKVKAANSLPDVSVKPGQRILVPNALLREVMRKPTPERNPETLPTQVERAKPSTGLLSYGQDAEGPYALYRLERGEASLYTPVVVRFTDYREHSDILAACEKIQRRSGIRDVREMKPGQAIKIPLDMLSARVLPADHPHRQAYEASLIEAARLRAQPARARNLEGVVVILDPGHGGKDPGADAFDLGYQLYEDELCYDLACRIKRLLEQETAAKVCMIVRDRSQGFAPVGTRKFHHDEDEEVLTTPPYPCLRPNYSAHLRWYLANALYRQALQSGIDKRKVIFTSIHCDALFDGTLRGTMIYIPGAQYRNENEQPKPESFYAGFAEARDHLQVRSTPAQRREDEALSRNFSEVLLEELGKKRVRRHKESAPIRNVIRQSNGEYYVPAVLRNTEIPTKILLEAANMTNRVDGSRLADPDWRQLFAEAYVNALKSHFGS